MAWTVLGMGVSTVFYPCPHQYGANSVSECNHNGANSVSEYNHTCEKSLKYNDWCGFLINMDHIHNTEFCRSVVFFLKQYWFHCYIDSIITFHFGSNPSDAAMCLGYSVHVYRLLVSFFCISTLVEYVQTRWRKHYRLNSSMYIVWNLPS